MRLDSLFHIKSGVLAINYSIYDTYTKDRILFIRPSKTFSGSIAGYVRRADVFSHDIYPPETIYVSTDGDGSHTYAYVSTSEIVCNSNVAVLIPIEKMTLNQKIYYSKAITMNRWLFSYGRKPKGDRLGKVQLPALDKLPQWVNTATNTTIANPDLPLNNAEVLSLTDKREWSWFSISELFNIKKGKRLTKADQKLGSTPYIGAIDSNNGLSTFINNEPIHEGNTITVNYNGNGVAEAFYQPVAFWASDDVNVLYPKFEMTVYSALFITTIIRREKYRYNYGRKWHVERMETSMIKLPSKDGQLDIEYMEMFIKSMPFSSNI